MRNSLTHLFMVLICIGFTGTCYASLNNLMFGGNGIQNYGEVELDSLYGNGSINLDGTKILGGIQVNGSLNAKNAHIGKAQINGKAIMTNCAVSGEMQINGHLEGTNSDFQGGIVVCSEMTLLNSCRASSILVRKVSDGNKTQVVNLKGKTEIAGTISFEGEKGEVWISPNSQIHGDVVGGIVVVK